MPELPEVETVRKQLNRVLKRKEVIGVEVLREKSFKGKRKNLIGEKVERVERKAKLMVMVFEGRKRLLIHLKMTGQLVWVEEGKKRVVGGHPTADWVNELPSKHTRVVIDFKDGGKLYFNDMRVFGWMKLVEEGEWKKIKKEMPVDVVDKEFTVKYLKNVLKNSRRAVKLVIMDQKKIGGVGNIYANDGLYLANIRPDKKARDLSDGEVSKLHKNLVKVIREGIRMGGATASDERFVDVYGLGGRYQEKFKIYDREGQKCQKCGKKIEKIKLGGRGTYFCPGCQI